MSLKSLEIEDNLRTKLNWCCRASHEHSLRFLVKIISLSESGENL